MPLMYSLELVFWRYTRGIIIVPSTLFYYINIETICYRHISLQVATHCFLRS